MNHNSIDPQKSFTLFTVSLAPDLFSLLHYYPSLRVISKDIYYTLDSSAFVWLKHRRGEKVKKKGHLYLIIISCFWSTKIPLQ